MTEPKTKDFGAPEKFGAHVFRVEIPNPKSGSVMIIEDYGYRGEEGGIPRDEERVILTRTTWSEIADVARREFNERLKAAKESDITNLRKYRDYFTAQTANKNAKRIRIKDLAPAASAIRSTNTAKRRIASPPRIVLRTSSLELCCRTTFNIFVPQPGALCLPFASTLCKRERSLAARYPSSVNCQ